MTATAELKELAMRVFDAMEQKGWRVDERFRVIDEEGTILDVMGDLARLAWCCGLRRWEEVQAAWEAETESGAQNHDVERFLANGGAPGGRGFRAEG